MSFAQTPGEVNGSAWSACSPWAGKESDTTLRVSNNNNKLQKFYIKDLWDLPGGKVGKNPPAKAGTWV